MIFRLFINGLNIPFEKLYPEIQYPVSRGTPMLSPLVRWDHSEDWFCTKFELQRTTQSWERKVKVSLKDQDYDSIEGHIIDGNLLLFKQSKEVSSSEIFYRTSKFAFTTVPNFI